MAFTYGYQTDSLDAPLVKSLAEFVKLLNDGLPPERNLMLTAFPFCASLSLWWIEGPRTRGKLKRDGAVANIPPWFPGATFKRDALRSQELSMRSLDGPFEYVMKSMVRTMNPHPINITEVTPDPGEWFVCKIHGFGFAGQVGWGGRTCTSREGDQGMCRDGLHWYVTFYVFSNDFGYIFNSYLITAGYDSVSSTSPEVSSYAN